MAKFLPAELLPLFLDELARHGELHGPALTDQGVTAFGPVTSAGDLFLHYHRTLLPPKKYLLPPKATTFSWNDATGYEPVLGDLRPIVLFGLHQCDLAGIAYLDGVFRSDPPDLHYSARRSRLILVGLSCEPDAYCFCGSLDAPHAACDLFMAMSGTDFVVSACSATGARILDRCSLPMEDRESAPTMMPEIPEELSIREAVSRGETFPDHPLWEEFSAACLSCGACSLCCPTCYCFDTREMAELGSNGAARIREWDNCLFRCHGEIAGGQNFRPTRVERFHYRYRHKYLGFGPTRGVTACVGCGRCREVCPVRIDLLKLFQQNQLPVVP